MEEPGGLHFMGSQRVKHNWETKHKSWFWPFFFGTWTKNYTLLKDCKTEFNEKEYMTEIIYGLQSLTYIQSDPLQ